jgi:hypothetical protein
MRVPRQAGAATGQPLVPCPCVSSSSVRATAAVAVAASSAHMDSRRTGGVRHQPAGCSGVMTPETQSGGDGSRGGSVQVRAWHPVCSARGDSSSRSVSRMCVAHAVRHDHDSGIGPGGFDDRDDWGSGMGRESGGGDCDEWGGVVGSAMAPPLVGSGGSERWGGALVGSGIADASRPGATAAAAVRSSSSGSSSSTTTSSNGSNGSSSGEGSVRSSGDGDDAPRPLTLSWPGSGLYFFWQLGMCVSLYLTVKIRLYLCLFVLLFVPGERTCR